jgi:hypothetical protein
VAGAGAGGAVLGCTCALGAAADTGAVLLHAPLLLLAPLLPRSFTTCAFASWKAESIFAANSAMISSSSTSHSCG